MLRAAVRAGAADPQVAAALKTALAEAGEYTVGTYYADAINRITKPQGAIA